MHGQKRPHHPHSGGNCHCPHARLERFIEPCLLLLLAERPEHGYQLIERLADSPLGQESPDPGLVYRTLRRLEELGVVMSEWETGGVGPARRLYQLTPEGIDYLAAWRRQIEDNISRLQSFLRRHDCVFAAR